MDTDFGVVGDPFSRRTAESLTSRRYLVNVFASEGHGARDRADAKGVQA